MKGRSSLTLGAQVEPGRLGDEAITVVIGDPDTYLDGPRSKRNESVDRTNSPRRVTRPGG